MAGEFLQQFNPMQLVYGYEYGQKSQREEEKALEDTRNQQLRNELLGTTVGEFKSPEFTRTRQLENELAARTAELASTLRGYEGTVAKDQGQDILGALRAKTTTSRIAAEQNLAKQGVLGELQPKEFDIMRGDVTLRGKQQQVQIAGVEDALRTVGAGDTFRQSYKDLPVEASVYDRLLYTYTNVPDDQKAAVFQQMIQQNAKDLAQVNTPDSIDQWYKRPGNPFRSRAVVEGNQLVVYPIVGKNERGEDIISRSGAQVFPDVATWRASVGSQIAGLAGASRSTAAAKPAPGAVGNSLATSIMGGGATATAPTAAVGGAAPAVARSPAAPPGAVFSEQVSVTEQAPPAAAPTPAVTPQARTQAPAPAPAVSPTAQVSQQPIEALLFETQQRFPPESETGQTIRQAFADVTALKRVGEPVPPEIESNLRKLVNDVVTQQEERYRAQRENSLYSGAVRGVASGMESLSRYISETERHQAEEARRRLLKTLGPQGKTAPPSTNANTVGVRG